MQPRWNQIEGLRALAAVCVFALHAWVILGMASALGELILPTSQSDAFFGEPLSKFLLAFFGHLGPTGVSLFYAISGFLLYQPFLRARERGEHLELRSYLLRRAARIIPAYWLALVVIGVLQGNDLLFTWDGIVNYFFFGEIYTTLNFDHITQALAVDSNPVNIYDAHAYNVIAGNPVQVAWTLCVEVSFYLFLPVWSWLMAKSVDRLKNSVRAEVVVLFAVAAASLGWQFWLLTRVPNTEFEPWLMILPSSIDIFAVGMILSCLASVVSERGWPMILRTAGTQAWAWWLSAAVIYLVLAYLESRFDTTPTKSLFPIFYGDFVHRARMVWSAACFVITMLLLAPAIVGNGVPSRVAGFLTWKFAAWVGLVSYGLYLWHVWVLRQVSDLVLWIGGNSSAITSAGRPAVVIFPLGVVVALAASLGIAAASWYGLESKVLAWAHRLPLARKN